MPPQEGKYKIVAEQVRNTKTAGVVDLRPVAYMADTPYKSGQWRGEAEEFKDVREYLAKLKQNNPDVAYKYAWYREIWAIYNGFIVYLVMGTLLGVGATRSTEGGVLIDARA